ncbi:high-affinity branched-chain amino acid ABC transporter permease LivM [Propylenella binzhouense]|uniref:High-affinity branched-chain amino acid ABC transporter permease LivM n=1 Tax=Propylenella binzhouense TaxID=2555902 RepID=A0A964T589_9HYPH|nr:high-affinity branched-chain amino acid ABC transporter permease LivM [Propylenella binzhouense]MYZ48089.1 high-affinity branched-chain amino acid ABC transporter permease LivM [Propylenella binzhouense]
MAEAGSVADASDLRPAGAEIEEEKRRDAVSGEPPFKQPRRRDGGLRAALRDALFAALVAAVLGFFFLGLRTEIGPGGLVLSTRWGLFATAVAIVFAGRLLLRLFVFRDARPRTVTAAAPGWAAALTALGRLLGPGLLVLALAFPFLILWLFPQRDRQYLDLAILILTYVMLGWGLNIVVGLAGLLDLGYVAFYAVGAYSFALIAQNFGLGFWLCLPLAGLLAACWGLILGFPVLRLRGDYLAIVTLAFGEIIRIILLNWYDFTGGPNGISGIPKPTFLGMDFSRGEDGVAAFLGIPYDSIHRFVYLYYIILGLALLTNFVTLRLRRLPIGRAWEALREDEIACRSLGINTTNTKLTAFATGAMFGGIAGSFFATRQGFISPESFTFLESAIILAIVVLGGLGSQIGVVIASVVMIGGIELLRNLGFLRDIFGPGFDPTQYRMLIFGLAMVVIMVWKPRGLISSREPSAVLKERKLIGADMVAQGEGH